MFTEHLVSDRQFQVLGLHDEYDASLLLRNSQISRGGRYVNNPNKEMHKNAMTEGLSAKRRKSFTSLREVTVVLMSM